METVKIDTPPLLVERDGAWWIEVVHGNMLVLAPIGDGSWLLEQIVEKLASPALRMRLKGLRVPDRGSD